MEEGRRVDDDHVVRLARHLEQAGQLGLRDELGVLGAQRRREHVEPGRVPGRVAGQLLGVELARSRDQVVDRLLRLDPEHDRGVAELQVEVEKERTLAPVLRERGTEVGCRHGLAGPALGREHRDQPPVPTVASVQPLADVARLADREDDVVGQLRQKQDVGDVVLERIFEQRRRAVRGQQDDRRPRVLTQGGDLVHRQRCRASGVQDDLKVAACQRRRGLAHLSRRAYELDFGVVRE